jgi:hypothetical protein
MQNNLYCCKARYKYQRDRDWGPYTPVGPASWMMGTEKLKICTIGKKLFCTGPTGSAVWLKSLAYPSGEEGGKFLVQMISTCLRYT